jgi:hypothetical protein
MAPPPFALLSLKRVHLCTPKAHMRAFHTLISSIAPSHAPAEGSLALSVEVKGAAVAWCVAPHHASAVAEELGAPAMTVAD